ncbi:unnamed protein product [Lactuca virosa]|uniref:Uncharacterized protein n=1 Tax=Lactuca virosa TaxID=75947 RepID=A0AAU9LWG6_9ASTR|nr:unnamed protein product [Lactuca virosa]
MSLSDEIPLSVLISLSPKSKSPRSIFSSSKENPRSQSTRHRSSPVNQLQLVVAASSPVISWSPPRRVIGYSDVKYG